MRKKKKENTHKEDTIAVENQASETGEEKGEEKNEAEDIEEEASSMEESLKKELSAEKDKFLRLFAEFENYKKRTSRERIELFKTAGENIMLSMLPVLDDFDRALGLISKSTDKELLKGVKLISNKFRDVLKSKGLTEIEADKGDVFDAEFHEAITQIPAPEEKLKGKIIDITEKGYKLGEKVIRYPKVVVGK